MQVDLIRLPATLTVHRLLHYNCVFVVDTAKYLLFVINNNIVDYLVDILTIKLFSFSIYQMRILIDCANI